MHCLPTPLSLLPALLYSDEALDTGAASERQQDGGWSLDAVAAHSRCSCVEPTRCGGSTPSPPLYLMSLISFYTVFYPATGQWFHCFSSFQIFIFAANRSSVHE